MWAKGQSGNPGGRPRVAFEIRRMAQEDALEAYRAILAVLRNPEHKHHLTAALAVMRIAGIPMTAEVNFNFRSETHPGSQSLPVENLEANLGPPKPLLQ